MTTRPPTIKPNRNRAPGATAAAGLIALLSLGGCMIEEGLDTEAGPGVEPPAQIPTTMYTMAGTFARDPLSGAIKDTLSCVSFNAIYGVGKLLPIKTTEFNSVDSTFRHEIDALWNLGILGEGEFGLVKNNWNTDWDQNSYNETQTGKQLVEARIGAATTALAAATTTPDGVALCSQGWLGGHFGNPSQFGVVCKDFLQDSLQCNTAGNFTFVSDDGLTIGYFGYSPNSCGGGDSADGQVRGWLTLDNRGGAVTYDGFPPGLSCGGSITIAQNGQASCWYDGYEKVGDLSITSSTSPARNIYFHTDCDVCPYGKD